MKAKVIVTDCPWQYDNERDNDPAQGGMTYPTMTLEDLKALPVGELADRDCALFLWATMPKLREALACLEAWDFNYVTCAFVWVKLNKRGLVHELTGTRKLLAPFLSLLGHLPLWEKIILLLGGLKSGTGHWTNSNAEIVLFAKKKNGRPVRIRRDIKQIVLAPLGARHSEKPREVQDRIVQLLGDAGPRVELFAREPYDGWICLGNDIDGRDIRESLPELIRQEG